MFFLKKKCQVEVDDKFDDLNYYSLLRVSPPDPWSGSKLEAVLLACCLQGHPDSSTAARCRPARVALQSGESM